ncbi:hypothetical protein C2W62_12415 [Candidatus Entotheonella serta]|nr:hypothetical protein C2W62_12415 [Candidatus Entotheonella serta]
MATTHDRHSGLQFTSGGVDYIGLKFLEHKDNIGSIWLAILKDHDLETGPVTPVIVLTQGAVTPVDILSGVESHKSSG